ncbi:MAG: hypothetical protein J6C82_04145 [Clostridia bacterium]|nr:hypothetical protein [Clostridia bacterium]
MKKLVSVVLAALVMTFSATAFAAEAGELSSSRNSVTTLAGEVTASSIPGFRPTDTLLFNLSGLTTENQMTLISYKVNSEGVEADLDNTTIQYINQYTLDADTKEIKYTIRDIEEGIYKIVINDGTTTLNYFYKVGNPQIELIRGANDTDYITKEEYTEDGVYSIAFVAKASLGPNVSFEEVGISDVGFYVENTAAENKNYTATLTNEKLTELYKAVETDGDCNIYYGVTIYNIPADTDVSTIKVEPQLIPTSDVE